MDNLLKTLLEMDDGVGLINMDMISGISWKYEEDKFESNQVPSHHGFLPASSFELFSPSPLHFPEMKNSIPLGTHFMQSSPQIWAIEEKGTSSRRLQELPKAKMSGKRRMKASEREKLRMRRLAHALHTLRSFLPPNYSQRGEVLQFCADHIYNITEVNKSASINCSDGQTGKKIKRCQTDGKYGKEEDFCVSPQLNNILQSAKNSTNLVKELPNLVGALANFTKPQGKITPGNLAASVDTLKVFSSVSNVSLNQSVMENFLSVVDLVIDENSMSAWESVKSEQKNSTSELLKSVEDFTRLLSPINQTFNIIKPNIQLKGIKVESGKNYNIHFNAIKVQNKSISNAVFVNQNELERLRKDSLVMSIALPTMNNLLSQPASNSKLNSLVMATTAEDSSIAIKMDFMLLDPTLNQSSAQCVHWNLRTGEWDSEGCTHELNGNNVTCNCNHLTSFSLLMSKRAELHETKTLNTINRIALGISQGSLIIGIIIEAIVWKNVTKNKTSLARHIAILNIALSLLILNASFIAREYLEPKILICTVVIFFVHFFLLALFFWMFTLALLLLYHLIFLLKDFSKSSMMLISFSLGYACPFVITASVFVHAYIKKHYIEVDKCWINARNSYLHYTFSMVPLVIVGINLLITLFAIVKMLRPAVGEKSSDNINEKNSVRKIVRCVVILTPLLGLTWILGFMFLDKPTHIALSYLFDILNGLQGFFILLFGIIMDSKVQEVLKQTLLSRTPSQKSLTGTSSTANSTTY
ncbi:adhesion G protein-coupled receptor F5-like [Pristis pectinata]|uniref:adhesion G protein-coupled receptor F5-like n=1 Tax=Pristis pectinata TaxID=685728 RepID=UPI00223D4713|nr:adhesion G protein-coupled receptor F5-like [Pristis pectinata]